jgi:hypothetical protein
MFDSRARLAEQIGDLLEAIRVRSGGRYACLLEPGRVVFERAEPEWREAWMLRGLVERHKEALFAIPHSMASGDPIEDVLAGWDEDEFLLAVINGRVALVVACPEAEAARDGAFPILRALADRLLRYDERYRMDTRGRGFFLGRPKLDLVVIGRPSG